MYDKYPCVQVSSRSADCAVTWPAIAEALRPSLSAARVVFCLECYPDVIMEDLFQHLLPLLRPSLVIDPADFCFPKPHSRRWSGITWATIRFSGG